MSETIILGETVAEEETIDTIVLKNRDGEDVVYSGVVGIALLNTDGEVISFLQKDTGTGGTDTSDPVSLHEEAWINDVCFWDYDGTLLLNVPLSNVATFSELPTPPEHEGLTFLGWNFTLEQIRAYDYPIDVGAMYIPSDGKTHLHLIITNSSKLTMPLNFSQTVSGGVSINWGDGSVATVSGTGVVQATHTYSSVGEYDVVITVADGCTMTLGGGTSALAFAGSDDSAYQKYLTSLYIGNRVNFAPYALSAMYCLQILTIPNNTGIVSIPEHCIYRCSLKNIAIPDSVESIEDYGLYGWFDSTHKETQRNGAYSIPESVATVGTYFLYNSLTSRITVPKSITALPNYALSNSYWVKRIFLPDSITAFGNRVCHGNRSLRGINFPANLVTIGDYCCYQCYNLRKISIPSKVETIGSYFGYFATCLQELFIPATVKTINVNTFLQNSGVERVVIEGTTVFSSAINLLYMYALKEIIHLSEEVPTKVHASTYTFYDIWVPDNALEAYKAVYEQNSNYYCVVHPLSEYRGAIPTK